jgi:metal-dependent hydrolase (beta-lactamase superfamily II)
MVVAGIMESMVEAKLKLLNKGGIMKIYECMCAVCQAERALAEQMKSKSDTVA